MKDERHNTVAGGTRILLLLGMLLTLAACEAPMTRAPVSLLGQGEYGRARTFLMQRMTQNKSSRAYLLDRMRVGVLAMDDGYPRSAAYTFQQVYEVLRTQGINEDKTVSSVVFYEGVKIWKGEPFEQALALTYYGLQQAALGEWDNARAAAKNSLFRLRDFRTEEERKSGATIDSYAIVKRALEYEMGKRKSDRIDEDEEFLNSGYAVRESDYVLGYVLHGIASQQLNRQQEANDFFAVAAEIDPSLKPLLSELRRGDYNTILVVAAGLGPAKEAYGPDNALARFSPRTLSSNDPLLAWLEDTTTGRQTPQALKAPVITDVNRMAASHMWNNLEDIRKAKSVLGSVLLTGGAIATGYGVEKGDDAAVIAGVTAMAIGAAMKAGARADTRYCDVMPQRFYVVPLSITRSDQLVHLQLGGHREARMTLVGLQPPDKLDPAQLRYVRMPMVGGQPRTPAWAHAQQVIYANDVTGPTAGRQLPYMLGGQCVRLPEAAALRDYHRSGHLLDTSLATLQSAYRDAGLRLDFRGETPVGLHVLEGGKSLIPPQGGTAGFKRLFCQSHPPYVIQSRSFRELAKQVNAKPGSPVTSQSATGHSVYWQTHPLPMRRSK